MSWRALKAAGLRTNTRAVWVSATATIILEILAEVAEHLPPILIDFFGGRRLAVFGPSTVSRLERGAVRPLLKLQTEGAFKDPAHEAISGNAQLLSLRLHNGSQIVWQLDIHALD